MSQDKRGIRDGTGPYKDSFERRNNPEGPGKRKRAGETCPRVKTRNSK